MIEHVQKPYQTEHHRPTNTLMPSKLMLIHCSRPLAICTYKTKQKIFFLRITKQKIMIPYILDMIYWLATSVGPFLPLPWAAAAAAARPTPPAPSATAAAWRA
jgi:hypothetical protein